MTVMAERTPADDGTTAAERPRGDLGRRGDDALSSDWSVLVRGSARTVTDPDERRRLDGQVHSGPWADGGRDLWMRVEPDRVTGRRIRV